MQIALFQFTEVAVTNFLAVIQGLKRAVKFPHSTISPSLKRFCRPPYHLCIWNGFPHFWTETDGDQVTCIKGPENFHLAIIYWRVFRTNSKSTKEAMTRPMLLLFVVGHDRARCWKSDILHETELPNAKTQDCFSPWTSPFAFFSKHIHIYTSDISKWESKPIN